ncbi:hypothetical protein DsansV1_C03g0025161 [Dioscorea sansibarensis]
MTDLETKKQKLIQGGAPAAAVRVCSLCNVVCNRSLSYHLMVCNICQLALKAFWSVIFCPWLLVAIVYLENKGSCKIFHCIISRAPQSHEIHKPGAENIIESYSIHFVNFIILLIYSSTFSL